MKQRRHLPDVIAQCVAIVPELGSVFADMLALCKDEGFVAPEMRERWWYDRWMTSTGIVFGAMQAFVIVGHVDAATDDKVKRIWNAQGGS